MRWHEMETRADFAFFLESWQEAEDEAGSEVAAAWQVARAECQRGLAARVRDLYEREAQAVCRATPAQPVAALAHAGGNACFARAPRVTRSVCLQQSAAPLLEANARHLYLAHPV